MNILKAISECLSGRISHRDEATTTTINEKTTLVEADVADQASRLLTVLCQANTSGAELDRKVKEIISADDDIKIDSWWTERLAEYLLAGLEKIVKDGTKVGPVMEDALKKAVSAAVGFAKDHPVYVTLIALGVLVMLAPWAIEALGFGELGPIEGTFAAWWQARYAGYVPKGSLFSYFQRLGMTWKHWTAKAIFETSPFTSSMTFANYC